MNLGRIQSGITSTGRILGQEATEAANKAKESAAAQQASAKSLSADLEEEVPSGAQLKRYRSVLEELVGRTKKKGEEKGTEGKALAPVKEIDEETERDSQQFFDENPGLSDQQKERLKSLLAEIKPEDSKAEILNKLNRYFPPNANPVLAELALKYLMSMTDQQDNVKEAAQDFNTQYGGEVRSAKAAAEQKAAKPGTVGAASIQDLYRDILHNPRDVNKLFDELSGKFSYRNLVKVIQSLMHLSGRDLKRESAERPELHAVISEVRILQGVLGVYRFFNSRMELVKKEYEAKTKTPLPPHINFESLAKEFVGLTMTTYLSESRVLQVAEKLGVRKNTAAAIIIISQMRDAVGQVSPRLYNSQGHKNELYTMILSTLETLDEEFLAAMEQLADGLDITANTPQAAVPAQQAAAVSKGDKITPLDAPKATLVNAQTTGNAAAAA